MLNARKIIEIVRKMQGNNCYVQVGQRSGAALLADRIILVTGGGSGIGFQIAKACTLQGAQVIITGRNKDKLLKAENSIRKQIESAEISSEEWDISKIEDIERHVSDIISRFGRLDALVNNAGIFTDHNYTNVNENDFDDVMDTNLKGPYFLTNHVVNYWQKQGMIGNVLFISSETGLCAYTSPYAMSKCALIQYALGLAFDLAKKGIRSNVIAPGGTVSDINHIDKSNDLSWNSRPGRFLIPEEIAETAVFLLSDLSKCINGQILECNGGNTIRVEAFRHL